MRIAFLRFALASLLVMTVLAIAPVMESAPFAAQAQSAPMTLSGLVAALKKGIGVLPASEFVQTIQRRGVSFELTASAERQLQQAGATPAILQAVRANFRGARAAAPTPAPSTASHLSPAADDFNRGDALYKQNNYEDARPFIERACSGGSLAACSDLGYMLEYGKGIPMDVDRAVALYRKACVGEDAHGCSNLGAMYANGTGVTQDNTQAVALYRKACDGGYALGCSNLGAMYANGTGVPLDYMQANILSRKGCDGGDAEGCNNLGVMYEKGKGVAPDKTQAIVLYRNACDAGIADGCTNLKRLQP